MTGTPRVAVSRDRHRPRRGSALVLVLIMTLSLAGLAVSAVFLSSSSNILQRFYDKERDFRYTAASAIALGRSRLTLDTSLALASDTATALTSAGTLTDASGTSTGRYYYNLYGAFTGDTSGRYRPTITLFAQGYDSTGVRSIRRQDYLSDPFSRYAVYVDSFPSTLGFTNGEYLHGRAYSNRNWYSTGSPGPDYYDTVSAAGTFTGSASTHGLSTVAGAWKAPYPSTSTLPAYLTYARAGNDTLTPVSGTGTPYTRNVGAGNVTVDYSGGTAALASVSRSTRLRFKTVDANNNGTVDASDGFMEVFDSGNQNNAVIDTSSMRADLVRSGTTPWFNIVLQNQCGVLTTISGRKEFFPIARIREPWVLHRMRSSTAPTVSAADSTTMAGGPLTGTYTFSNGNLNVSGTGTLFTTELAVGDSIAYSTHAYKVASILSNTALTLVTAATANGNNQAVVNITKLKAGYAQALSYGAGWSRCYAAGSPYLMLAERNVDNSGANQCSTVSQSTASNSLWGWGTSSASITGGPCTTQQYGGQDTTFSANVFRCYYDVMLSPPEGKCYNKTSGDQIQLGSWRAFPGTHVSGISSTVLQSVEQNYLWPINTTYNSGYRGVVYAAGPVYVSGTVRGDVTLYAVGTVVLTDDVVYDQDPTASGNLCRNTMGIVARDNVYVADNAMNRPRPGPLGTFWMLGTPDFTVHGSLMAVTGTVGVEGNSGTAATSPSLACRGTASSGGCLTLIGAYVARYLSMPYSGAGTGLRWNQVMDPCQVTSRRPPFFPLTGRTAVYKTYEIETKNLHTWSDIKTYYGRLRGSGRVVP